MDLSEVMNVIKVYDQNLLSKLIQTVIYLYLPILTLHNVLILIKSVFNKNQMRYYQNVYLEKYLG